MRMRLVVLFLCGLAASTFGQSVAAEPEPQAAPPSDAGAPVFSPPPEPHCDAYTMQFMPELGFKRKACYYGSQLFSGSALFGAAFFAGLAQWQKDPAQWPLGADGFGRRFGTRYAQGMVKSTGAFVVGALNHEDPRPHPPQNPNCDFCRAHARKSGFFPRTGSALLRVVWAHRDNCSDGIAFSHFAGALSSGFVGMAWTPSPGNTVGQSFARSGTAFGGDVAASVFAEFQTDIFNFAGKIFGGGKPK
jgi:hypothetical protein